MIAEPVSRRITLLAFVILMRAASGAAQSASLRQEEVAAWMATGQKCQAPLTRIATRDGNFEIFIEDPGARAAIVAAAATMNHQPLDAVRVRTSLRDGYRIWASYTDSSRRDVSVSDITIQATGTRELRPAASREERLALGIASSHGIIEAVRVRFPEFTFPTLPEHDFYVVLHTTVGIQRYHVTPTDRTRLMGVCNGPPP
jgi:hypothetical protein